MTSDGWIHLGFLVTLIPLIASAINGFIERGKMQQKIDTLWCWFEENIIKEKK